MCTAGDSIRVVTETTTKRTFLVRTAKDPRFLGSEQVQCE